jgi:tetratricopeptide (TPR) repeat protein
MLDEHSKVSALARYEIEPNVGEYIRQVRREQNLTQTELGGTRFSKSYVSAVERNKIPPSREALQFFAEQLAQPADYFTTLSQLNGDGKQLTVPGGPRPAGTGRQVEDEEEFALLDILLDGAGHYSLQALERLPGFSLELLATLPPPKQARYAFLTGLAAQQKQDYATALNALEGALALAPAKQHPAILNALGRNYYLTCAYATALNYHLRAFDLLQQEAFHGTAPSLHLNVALHCGDDYRAMGAYRQASAMYERARAHLNAEHDMKTAGDLYLGLGYCTYAGIPYTVATPEEMEHLFQHAISMLLQSKSVYHASSNHQGETDARLTLAMVELDFSIRRGQQARRQNASEGKQLSAHFSSLLEEAEEQCRQILMIWQQTARATGEYPEQVDGSIYTSLAYLMRVFVQRAALARLSGYAETALRERSLAAHLCQDLLDMFCGRTLPGKFIANTLSARVDRLASHSPSLPLLPAQQDVSRNGLHSPVSHVEVYFAAGEVAEELGRAATGQEYAHKCYTRADQFFREALRLSSSTEVTRERDCGYTVYCYQRFASTLEERFIAMPALREESSRTVMDMLKDGLYQLQQAMLPAGAEQLSR